jgi:hypothetical protein
VVESIFFNTVHHIVYDIVPKAIEFGLADKDPAAVQGLAM